jgi:hypothetical protein
MSINLPFSSKCIHEVDSIFRMTTFVKYTGTVAAHWQSVADPGILFGGQVISFLFPSFPSLPFSSLRIPFPCKIKLNLLYIYDSQKAG